MIHTELFASILTLFSILFLLILEKNGILLYTYGFIVIIIVIETSFGSFMVIWCRLILKKIAAYGFVLYC